MSRDQRPGRTVMVDAVPKERRASEEGTKVAAVAPVATTKPPKTRVLIPLLLFLVACIAGAVGFMISPLGGA